MLPVSFSPTGTIPSSGGYTLSGASTSFMIWNASYRERNPGLDDNSTANREDNVAYIRGLREMITFRTSGVNETGNAAGWLWRRILFTAKGLYQALGTSVDHAFTSQGYVRFLANHNGTTYGSAVSGALFEGVVNVDWTDLMTAKCNNEKFTVLYDKVTRLNPQSSAPQYWKHKRWHPINKNLVYDNEENGPNETTSGYSTLGKPGCGDVYVVDIFSCASMNSQDTLYFAPEATLYWHEK